MVLSDIVSLLNLLLDLGLDLGLTPELLSHTLFGGLASNAAPRRYNLRIVTDIAIVGPRTLVTAGS